MVKSTLKADLFNALEGIIKDIVDEAIATLPDPGEDEEALEEESEDVADDDDGDLSYTEEELAEFPVKKLTLILREDLEAVVPKLSGTAKKRKATLIEAILEAQEEPEDEDEGEDEEYEEYDSESLEVFTLAELRSIAKEEFAVPLKKGMKKPTIIKAILKAQEEEEDEDFDDSDDLEGYLTD